MKLSRDKITGIYCIVDDLLKSIEHSEDKRRRISDSEVRRRRNPIKIWIGFLLHRNDKTKFGLYKPTVIIMNIEQGIMNVEGSKVEIRMNEFQNSVFVSIPNYYSLFLVQYSLFPLLGIKTDIH